MNTPPSALRLILLRTLLLHHTLFSGAPGGWGGWGGGGGGGGGRGGGARAPWKRNLGKKPRFTGLCGLSGSRPHTLVA
jgi:hypothetical protein